MGCCFPSPGDLPDFRIEPMSPALAGGFFITCAIWEAGLHTQASNQPILLEVSAVSRRERLSPWQLILPVLRDCTLLAELPRLLDQGGRQPLSVPGAPLTAPHPSVSPQALGGWWRTSCCVGRTGCRSQSCPGLEAREQSHGGVGRHRFLG